MNNNALKAECLLGMAAAARLSEMAVTALRQVPVSRLRQSFRGRSQVAQARQMAMYLAHIVFGLSLTRVGICFGRDRTTVRHACMLIEDRRDDPSWEFGLAALEAALLSLRNSLAGEATR